MTLAASPAGGLFQAAARVSLGMRELKLASDGPTYNYHADISTLVLENVYRLNRAKSVKARARNPSAYIKKWRKS